MSFQPRSHPVGVEEDLTLEAREAKRRGLARVKLAKVDKHIRQHGGVGRELAHRLALVVPARVR